MFDYHLQLLLSWTIRLGLWAGLGVIYVMTSGCSHTFDVNGTSSGSITNTPPAAGTTVK